ncbi:MAG TPA: bifunctional phosphopantothenoylcysteine decarboxylase/phosphopantothenate--cysteine ligase CoaBC [Bacteroidia bacterium]|nr:bifunctional phosphopantothenoylcysteine decarboxylase/phosphopantothenate--cysteine ligase CoaBC [Bacteroidia bacterium]HNU33750.1 bifunctional phosphopantothenoylcysteine decarboxylase/phosphopantothenate--cysteine ligase CoaBC [Bacteroidia bacterium]
MLQGKKILLGVTGSIAAYKTPELVRQLVKKGALVKVIVTESATDFVSPLVLSVVSKNKVYTSFYSESKSVWNNHVELGLWADLFLIAPASANTVAKMSSGICDNLLLATYLSAKCPVAIAPAMDLDMYKHYATRRNISSLKESNVKVIGPDAGELASGLTGEGRMTEPVKIVAEMENYFSARNDFTGKKVLVTAGPTYEAIDPVRFIGNHSSGKMGIAIATEFAKRGAKVILVCGPGVSEVEESGISKLSVTSADDMFNAVQKHFGKTDIAVMAAAVADFTPIISASDKIKKDNGEELILELKPTKDILLAIGKLKKKNQVLVGFALETNNELENAKKKLKNKNLDFIVLNSLNEKNKVFNSDFNQVTVINKNNRVIKFDTKTKTEVAKDIVDQVKNQLSK